MKQCNACGSYIITKEDIEGMRLARKDSSYGHADPVGEPGVMGEYGVIDEPVIRNAKSEAIKEYLAKVLEKKDIAGHFEPRHGVVAVSVLEYYAKAMEEGKL